MNKETLDRLMEISDSQEELRMYAIMRLEEVGYEVDGALHKLDQIEEKLKAVEKMFEGTDFTFVDETTISDIYTRIAQERVQLFSTLSKAVDILAKPMFSKEAIERFNDAIREDIKKFMPDISEALIANILGEAAES